MGSVKEILTRQPPEIIYHYTTQRGLLGIVANKSIWASHTQYLNDQQEFRHATGIVKNVITPRYLQTSSDTHLHLREMYRAMLEALDGLESANVCVCSFTERGDLLSQWRAYGGGASGFSLGFSGKFIRRVAKQQDWWLVPCLYEEAEQQALIENLVNDIIGEVLPLHGKRADSELAEMAAGQVTRYLSRYAPILKHHSFREEREWRIISRPLQYSVAGFGYREGTSMLVPYFSVPLKSKGKRFSLEEIIIGPTPHPQQSLGSLKGLLAKSELPNVRIRVSDTPYRNW